MLRKELIILKENKNQMLKNKLKRNNFKKISMILTQRMNNKSKLSRKLKRWTIKMLKSLKIRKIIMQKTYKKAKTKT